MKEKLDGEILLIVWTLTVFSFKEKEDAKVSEPLIKKSSRFFFGFLRKGRPSRERKDSLPFLLSIKYTTSLGRSNSTHIDRELSFQFYSSVKFAHLWEQS